MVHTLARGMNGIISWGVGWGCVESLHSYTDLRVVLARIGKRDWCAHSQGGSARHPWADHGVCGDRACTVPFNINEWGCCPDWEDRGWCAHSQGECTASFSWPWGVCRSVANQQWRHQQAVHCAQDGNVRRHTVTAPVVTDDCAKGLLRTWVNHQDGLLVWDGSGRRCVMSPFIVYKNGLLTRQCCDRWPLVAAPFLIVHLMCVCENIVDERWRCFDDPSWPAAPFSRHCCMHENWDWAVTDWWSLTATLHQGAFTAMHERSQSNWDTGTGASDSNPIAEDIHTLCVKLMRCNRDFWFW